MIKSIIIANTFGAVNFSHYFEPIPIQFRVSYEKENVDRVLPLVFIGEKEIVIHTEKSYIVSMREKAMLILLVVDTSFDETIAIDLLHKFVHIIAKHLKIVTDKQIIQNKEILHQILNEMIIHGKIIETRLSHIKSVVGDHMQANE